ncbi:MAG: PaaI family thioesterase [Dehalococcoidia bacterium]
MSDVSDRDERLAFVREFAQTSPYYQAMGMSLLEIDVGRALLRVAIRPSHLNADGIAHGGVLPAIADGAMGNALRTLNGEAAQVLTAEIHLHFLRPVTGGALLAEGRVVQSGRRVSFAEVEMRDEESGKPVARGSGVFVIQANN